jgi:hypothetical protein
LGKTGYYKRLLKLYRRLGVELEKSNFDYSFFRLSESPATKGSDKLPKTPNSRSAASKETTLIYNGSSGLSSRPISMPAGCSPSRLNIASLRKSLDYLLQVGFFALCYLYILLLSFYHVFLGYTALDSSHWISSATFSDLLQHTHLPLSFAYRILLPLFSCVATCSPEELLEYPAAELLEYIAHTFGTDHYIVKGGVRNVVNRLLARLPRQNIHLSCHLVKIRPCLTGEAKFELEDSAGNTYPVDHLILATQANQARALLRLYYKSLQDSPGADQAVLAKESERIAALARFRYTQSIVVNHYDVDSTLSAQISERRMLNLGEWESPDLDAEKSLDPTLQVSKDHIMATHDLSNGKPGLSSKAGEPLLQTTNPTVAIRPDKIVSSQVFERARVTMESRRTLSWFLDCSDKGSMQGLNGIWFVGAWAAEVSRCCSS